MKTANHTFRIFRMKELLSICLCSVVLVAFEAEAEMDQSVKESLWNLQQELKNGCQNPNEVPVSIISQPDGNLAVIHPEVVEADSSHVISIRPQNSLFSGHTHPAQSQIYGDGTRSGTDLGLSGRDVNNIKRSGIPGGAHDCASGITTVLIPASASETGEDEYGMLDCDDDTQTCNILQIPPEGITDHSLKDPNGNPIPRTVSPGIIENRYKAWLDCMNNVCQLGEEVCATICANELERKKLQKEQEQVNATQINNKQKKAKDNSKDKKKDTPEKPTPTPNITETIDFSKLESLVSKQASFIRGILASGEKASSEQQSQFNSLNKQYSAEFDRLKGQIGKISDPAQRSVYYSKLASINSRMNSEVDPLLAQGAKNGLFTI